MALRECPECGHNVSDKAETCPNCGHPVSQELSWLSEEASAAVSASELFEAQGALIGVLFGAGAIIVGSFLPWASITSIFGTIEIAGTSGDGTNQRESLHQLGVHGGEAIGDSTH